MAERSKEDPPNSREHGMDMLMRKVRAAQLLADVQKYFEAGRYAGAEFYLRQYPADGDQIAYAAYLRGELLCALDLPELATLAFRAALSIDPGLANARERMCEAEAAASRNKPSYGPRYLVIREWMAGFWSDVEHVIGACVTAEVAGRQPIVHWGSQSRYYSPTGENAWTEFFEPMSLASLDTIRDETLTVYPPRWKGTDVDGSIIDREIWPDPCAHALDILGRTEDVVVSVFNFGVVEILPYLPAGHPEAGMNLVDARRSAVGRLLRPKRHIIARVDEFAERHFGPGPMLAVHYRGLDKFGEQPGLDEINAAYPRLIDDQLKDEPATKIFLMTDTESFAAWCRESYGDRVVMTAAQRTDGTIGIHVIEGTPGSSVLGAEVLVDTLLAARCDKFIGLASSNVSIFVRDLKRWPAGMCELLGAPENDHPDVTQKYLAIETASRS